MKNKFIVIEGIDGAGKTTQTKFLIQRLSKQGKKVRTIHFPRHGQNIFGKLIDEYLANKFGPAPKLDYRLASLLYALDRFEVKQKINNWLKKGYWVILDRYVESNFGHQGGKIKNKRERLKVIQWLYDLDYKLLKNPKPDLVLFLDVPVKFVIELLGKTGKKQDGHESDRKYLRKTYQAYQDACQKFKYWQSIPCIRHNQLLAIEKIADKLWARIRKVGK